MADTIIPSLYRIRPLSRAAAEIESQTIYFAHPDSLNDPTEGLRDVFWLGDKIVWRNLFKHYLTCLNAAWIILVAKQESSPMSWDEIPIVQLAGRDAHPLKKFHDEIFAEFFAERSVIDCIDALSARQTPIRRNELAAHMRTLHMFAVTTIHQCHERYNPAPNPSQASEAQQSFLRSVAEVAKVIGLGDKITAEHPDYPNGLEQFYAAQNLMADELSFINRYNRRIDPDKRNKNFVFLEFPAGYVDRLESLVYPTWYAACFMEDCANSSVWGNYGESHTGVCLKFKATALNDRPGIQLNRINGFNMDGQTKGAIRHDFYPVNYDKTLEAIDFFGSPGRLPIPVLKRDWYADEDGNRSPRGDTIFSSEQAWRKGHWEAFQRSITRKSADWLYEKEHRLLLWGDLLDFSSTESRLARYEFDDLEGVIFGIRTPAAEKDKISRIIEKKCRDSGRTDFKFYQAYYSADKGTIEHAEQRFMKFTS